MRRTVAMVLSLAAGLLLSAGMAYGQTGQITGRVIDRATQQPLVGAQVYLDGTSFGGLTQDGGRYLIVNVPAGTYTLAVQMLGFHEGRAENVRVTAGETTTRDFTLGVTALRLQEVVVTGTADPVAGVKVPFTVGKVTKADLPVPAISAEAAIEGKVAGVRVVRGSGRPGSGAEVLLRGATSLTKGNEPLYVVDGGHRRQ